MTDKEQNHHNSERRKHPRINKNLSMKIVDRGSFFITETKNISVSGAYCKVDRLIPQMSKVAVTLFIPNTSKGKVTTKKINCSGLIVRIDKVHAPQESPPHYYAAIIFSDLRKADKVKIAEYVNYHLEEK